MIAQVLDNVNTIAKEVERSTRRKRRIRREHIVGAFKAARAIANGIAAVVPKAVPVAIVLNGLDQAVTEKKPKKKKRKKQRKELPDAVDRSCD